MWQWQKIQTMLWKVVYYIKKNGENMKIVLGSKNVSKQRSILIAMSELGFDDISITTINANSLVSSKPINDETLIGARNRNKNLYDYCRENNISFDLLISIVTVYSSLPLTLAINPSFNLIMFFTLPFL